MKICVIGTGYVGLVAGTCLAEMGNEVICVDKDLKKLEQLSKGIIPIYEPGLEELINANVAESRLTFTDDLKTAVEKSLVCFIAVGTPQGEDGSADLSYVYDVASNIGEYLNGYKVIVDKSTVPVGTAEKVTEIIKSKTGIEFDIVSNPEFLKQGAAVDDFLKPDRVVIGSNSQRATEIMQELYSPFLRTGNPVIIMDVKSAEMTKYAANSFLAVKISYANEIANICEKVGADAEMVRIGMCLDRYQGDIEGKTFAVWGLAFKPKTNDMREAPSITIINELLKRGAKIKAYDPKAFDLAQTIFGDRIEYSKSAYDALYGADAILLLTEWNEFRRPNFDKIKSLMKHHVIFDGRNQYDVKRITDKGFEYYCIGKKTCTAELV